MNGSSGCFRRLFSAPCLGDRRSLEGNTRGEEGRFGQATGDAKQVQSKSDAGSASNQYVTTVERLIQGSGEYGAGGVSC